MIRVTVELVPFGIESRKKVIGTAKIFNDGSGTSTRGSYKFEFRGRRNRLVRVGELKGFPRRRLLVMDLIGQCLKKAFDSRWKKYDTKTDAEYGHREA